MIYACLNKILKQGKLRKALYDKAYRHLKIELHYKLKQNDKIKDNT